MSCTCTLYPRRRLFLTYPRSRCNTSTPNTIYCGPFCASANYTGWTECLNCVEANGASEFLMKPIDQVLMDSNKLCASAVGNSFTPVSTITASPTTIAPLRETFTESNSQRAITITPWEGLASYADPSFWADYGKGASSTIAPSASGSGSSAAATTSGAAPPNFGTGRKARGVGIVALFMGALLA